MSLKNNSFDRSYENTAKSAEAEQAENVVMELVLKANQACEEGLYGEAITLYTEGLRREPQNAMVYSNRSAAFLHAADLRAALSDAERAIKLQPTWSKGYLRKGLALQHMTEYESSIVNLAQGLAYETQSRQILTAIVDTILLSNLRDTFDGTQKQLRKLGLDQNPFVMLSAIGQELLSAGRFNTALSVLKCAEQVSTDNLRLKGSLMSALASAHWKLGNLKQAITYMEEDLEICRSLGDQHGECRVMGNLGNAHYTTKQYDSALQYHKDQLLLATEIKSRKTAGLALGSLGHTYSAIGEHDQALACHEQCVALAREMGNKISEAEEYGNIGSVYLSKEEPGQALKYHEQHLSMAQELDNPGLQVRAYFNLATLYQQLQDYAEALKCYQEILTFGVKMRSRTTEMRAYAGLGSCTKQIGELNTALNYYQQYLSIALKIPDKAAISKAYCCLGNINQALGRLPEALEAHKNHLVKVLELRDRVAEGRVYGNLGNVHCAMGHFNKAVKLHEQALTIAIEEGDTMSQASTNGNLGIAYQGLGEDTLALKHLDAHLTISRECEDRDGQIKALCNLGNFHANKSDFGTAHDLFQEQLEISEDKSDVEAQCKSLNSLAVLFKMQGLLGSSINLALKSVNLATARQRLLAKNLINLAKLYLARGQHNEARKALRRAHEAQAASTQPDAQHCVVISDLAAASLLCGFVEAAQQLYSKLSDIAHDNSLFTFEMTSLAGYGKVNLHQGRYSSAKEHLESAISICRDRGLWKEEVQQQLALSRALFNLRQFEDAHSALVSARELIPEKAHPSQEDKNILSELSRGFGDLSLGKGDYEDALEHYKEQRRLLVGEEQVRETRNMVLCLWLLGSGYEAFKILDALISSADDDSPYLKLSLLEVRAKLDRLSGRLGAAIHGQEVRLDLARRQGDRLAEMYVLCDLAGAYLTDDRPDQALVHFDQALMTARDVEHGEGETLALLGQAKSYFHLGELESCVKMCGDVELLPSCSVEVLCECALLQARAYFELNDMESSVKLARRCVDQATHCPLLLAGATAILGHSLVQSGDGEGGHEALVSSCSQFEIILLQKNLDFVYEQITPIQEVSYHYLFEMQPKPIDNLWVNERSLRWERGRYLTPVTPFPSPHTASQTLKDLCAVLGPHNVCVVVRVDEQYTHTWYLAQGRGLFDYFRTEIQDRTEFLGSAGAAEVLFGCLVSDVKRLLQDPMSKLYVVMSEDVALLHIVEQLKFDFFPSTPVSICGCLDDLRRIALQRKVERSFTPTILTSHEVCDSIAQLINGRAVSHVEDIGSCHVVHVVSDVIAFSDLDPDTLYIGDLTADCLFLYNTSGLLYEDITRMSMCLLSKVQCILTILTVDESTPSFVQEVHRALSQGSSLIESVQCSSPSLTSPESAQCYGADWVSRPPSHVSGVKVMLKSADKVKEICPAIRATLEIVDKMKTGFNREGPILIQQDILTTVHGWDEILLSVGATIAQNQVRVSEDLDVEGLDEIRTLLTSLLDCGVTVCQEIVFLLNKNDINIVTQLVDLLDLYVSTTPGNSAIPRLPFPNDLFNYASNILYAVGFVETGQMTNSSVLLSISAQTSLLRVEATLFVLKTLFDLGEAEHPYFTPSDDVGAIEI